MVQRVGQRDLAAHAVPEQHHGQAGVAGDDGAAEDVEVGEEVGVAADVGAGAAGEPVAAVVEPVHGPAVGHAAASTTVA